MKLLATLAVLVLIVSAPVSLMAQDKTGKKSDPNPAAQAKRMVDQVLKQLEKAELTETQTTEIKQMLTKVAEQIAKQRHEAEVTPEILKKQAEVRKAAREAGKKPKEIQAEVEAAVALSEKQKWVIETTEAELAKVKVAIGKMLEPAQIAKLNEQFAKSLSERKNGKRKAAK